MIIDMAVGSRRVGGECAVVGCRSRRLVWLICGVVRLVDEEMVVVAICIILNHHTQCLTPFLCLHKWLMFVWLMRHCHITTNNPAFKT
jgi:hypothetical protein